MWDWDVISSVGSIISVFIASAALAITGLPQFSEWLKNKCFNKRLRTFFIHYKGINGILNEDYKSIACNNFLKFSTSGNGENRDKIGDYSIQFHKFNRIAIYNDEPKIKLNNVDIPNGYLFYRTISDDCIEIEFFDKCTNIIKKAFIHRHNNITQNDPNKKIFDEIIAWGKIKNKGNNK